MKLTLHAPCHCGCATRLTIIQFGAIGLRLVREAPGWTLIAHANRWYWQWSAGACVFGRATWI